MAIAHETTTTTQVTSATITIASVDTNVTDPCIVVRLGDRVTAGVTNTSITSSHGTFVLQGAREHNDQAGSWLWVCTAPSKLTGDITIEMSASGRAVGSATVYSGVNQTQAVQASSRDGAAASGTAASVTVTADTGNWIVDTMCIVGAIPTATGNQTERVNLDVSGGGTDNRTAAQDAIGDGTAIDMDWTLAPSDGWSQVAVALVEASGSPSVSIPVIMNQLRNQGIS